MKTTITLILVIAPMLLWAQATTTIIKESKSEKQAQQELLQGDTQMEKKSYAKAIDHYTKAIELNKELICAYVYRANAYEKLNKRQEACKDIQKANSLGCNRPEMPALLEKCNGKK